MRANDKIIKRILVLMLLSGLVFGNAKTVNAAEVDENKIIQAAAAADEEILNEIKPDAYLEIYSSEGMVKLARNAVVRTCSASLAISGSTATCAGTGSAYASLASSVKLTMTLQKCSGGSWSKVSSWSTTANSSTAAISKTATISSGTYRVKIVCTVGGESVTIYSTTKTK